ncbi:metallophosphoesterase [bacterium]|nr:metallophosphoesterase [bacterium]
MIEEQKAEKQLVTTPDSAGSDADGGVQQGRRDFLRTSLTGLTVISVSGPSFGKIASEPDFEVVYKTIRMPGLPDKLRGTRIAMISDIHSGPTMSRKDLVPYVKHINKLKPDAILLPGDFIQNKNEEIEPVCDVFRHLKAPYGVYGCTGNHDYFADADHVSNELEHAGVNMLRNEHAVLDIEGEQLALIGIDDVSDGNPFHSQFKTAVDGLDPRIPNILLCHKPYYLEDASEWGVNLMVSGHTHGGQIVLARAFGVVVTIASLYSGYIEGLYEHDDTQMYITRGIGTVGIPIRINCPPEITLLTLT